MIVKAYSIGTGAIEQYDVPLLAKRPYSATMPDCMHGG